MKKWMLLVAGTVSGLTLTASEVLLSHDILAAKTEIDIQKGGAMNALPQGGYRFTLTPETRECWVRIPVGLPDLKAYDELEFTIKTENSKAAAVLELNTSRPDNALVMKKNLFLKPGQAKYSWRNMHAGVSVPPTKLSLRMLNKQDNYHLPQSEIARPVDFEGIRFNVTREGVERLQKELDALFDTSRYGVLGKSAVSAADRERDLLKTGSAELLAVVNNAKATQADRIKALEKLYDLKREAGWKIEAAALKAADAPVVTAVTGGADKIFRDRRFPGRFSAPAKVELARQETESAQIALFPKRELKNVTVKWSALSDGQGNTIGPEQISIAPVGFVKPQPAAYVTELAGEWIPDPVLAETGKIDLARDHYQPYWVDVRAAAGQPAGTYKGTVEFLADGKTVATVPLEAEVWNFTLPAKLSLPSVISADLLGGISNFPRMYSNDAEAIAQWEAYMCSEEPEKLELSEEAKRLVGISMQTRQLYRDHRIPFSDIYRGVGKVHPGWKRRMILEDDGLFCLGYDKGRNKIEAIRPQVEAMRKEGTAGRAYIYGYDEITNLKAFQGMKRSYAEVKKYFPEVLRTAVALDYTYGELTGTTDTLDIWIVPPTEYLESMPAAERARKRGCKVWWYPCNWPYPPDANLLMESDATATRLIIGFMPWKFNVDGFLYYSSTFWIGNRQTENWLGRWSTSGNVTLKKYGVNDCDNEFSIETSTAARKAGIKQWATLNQAEPVPVIAEMEIDVAYMDADPKRKFEVELRFNYQDKSSETFRFPLDFGAREVIRFSETVTPKKPVKSVFYALWLENDNAKVTCGKTMLKQQGKSRKARHRLDRAISGGPLFEDYRLDVFASNGDGSFFYPGLSGTLPSVRAKLLRDGREDYEYLALLKKAVGEVEAGRRQVADKSAWLEQAKAALKVGDDVCAGLDTYTREGEGLLSYRARIGELLSQVQ